LNDLYDLCYQLAINARVSLPEKMGMASNLVGFSVFFPSESHSEIPGFGKKSDVRRPDLIASGRSQAFHGAK
jgi:hypothetical protein